VLKASAASHPSINAFRDFFVPHWWKSYARLAAALMATWVAFTALGLLALYVLRGRGPIELLPELLITQGVAAIAAFVAAHLVARRGAGLLHRVEEALSRATKGDFEGRVPNLNPWLIAPLAAAVDRLLGYLRTRFAELESNRDQLRTVLDSMAEAVIALDGEQRVLLVNRSACRLFPIEESSSLGRPLWELVRNVQLQEWVSQALQGAELTGGELQLLSPAARTLLVHATSLPRGARRGAIVVASDVSQLRRLERVRQEFVANASHELKTPLASIKACAETLLDGAIDDHEVRTRFLQTIHEQSERMDKLVKDMLALTRIESEGPPADLHAVDLAAVVPQCVERYRQAAKRKSMRLATEPPSEPIEVLAEEEALEQILDNLIDNAIKYTNEGGSVVVRWARNETGAAIEVEDTGIGIPSSLLPRIFERFYRVDRARSRALGGTGLGLAIVKHLAESLGGGVAVSSQLGKGSTFKVRLRLPEARAGAAP
jgi:two-component system, OmpR family, phosphate regulon sensor histidine kinase PhoR